MGGQAEKGEELYPFKKGKGGKAGAQKVVIALIALIELIGLIAFIGFIGLKVEGEKGSTQERQLTQSMGKGQWAIGEGLFSSL